MVTIYQVYKIQHRTSNWGENPHYQLMPFWRDDAVDGGRFPWVPFFDSKEEAITFINQQDPYSGEYTILEVYTGQRPYSYPEPTPIT